MKRIISFLLTVILLLGALPSFARDYTVTEKAAVLKEFQIMEGDPNGDLRLSDRVTRGEFAKMAVASSPYRDLVAAGIFVSPFYDVPYTDWSAPYVLVARESGIINGYPDASFRPNETVKLEEALNILLKLLGYTDADFALSYPYGQYALADRLSMLSGISAPLGSPLSRMDCLLLFFNFLDTKSKGASVDYAEALGYTLSEDAVLLATNETDTAVSPGDAATTKGTFHMTDLEASLIGRKGTLLIKDGSDLVFFLPNVQTAETKVVYEVLGDTVITQEAGQMTELTLDDMLPVYKKSTQSTAAAVRPMLAVGDSLTLYKNEAGELEYATYASDDLKGPFTVTGTGFLGTLPLREPTLLKDGAKISPDALSANDILYYSVSLNTVWVYHTRVTGVYDSASPNADMPTAVTLSGKTYSIESAAALQKLSSGGTFRTGDTVTLLLGKDGRIADAVSPEGSAASPASVSGYLTDTGSRVFTKDAETYSAYYAAVTLPDGTAVEYETKKDYKELKNSAVTVTINNGKATLTAVGGTVSAGGVLDWQAKTFGSLPLSPTLRILDTADLPKYAAGLTLPVAPQRLDGLRIAPASVLYQEENDAGELQALILKDVTGDAYRYGVISESGYSLGKNGGYGGASAYYQNGVETPILSSTTVFRYTKGTPVAVAQSGGETDNVRALTALNGAVSEVSDTAVKIGKAVYPLWDKVSVYRKSGTNGDYTLLPLSEIKGESGYLLTAYMDKPAASGGRVRIIIAE